MQTASKTEAVSPHGLRHTFSSLAVRDFRYLWLGLAFMMGSVQMQMVARSYLTYEITDSPLLLGLVSTGFALPMLTLALFGGAVADRFERRRVIQWSQATAAATALFVGVSISTDTVTWVHLFVASMIQGVLFSFLMPSRQTIIPQLVGNENLSNALALNAAAMSATTLVAPAVAGGLYVWVGPDGVYYVITGMAMIAVVLTGLIGLRDRSRATADSGTLEEIKAGLSYIRRSHLVLVLLAMGLATVLLAMPFRMLLPIFVVDIYDRGPEALGLLVSIMGVGSLGGSLLIAAVGPWRRGMILLASSFASGVALLLVAALPYYYLAAMIMLLLGLGDAGRRTLNQALIMEEVEDEYRGRVMSVFMMNFGLMPLGILPAAAIAQLVNAQVAIATLAVLLLAVTAFIFFSQARLRALR